MNEPTRPSEERFRQGASQGSSNGPSAGDDSAHAERRPPRSSGQQPSQHPSPHTREPSAEQGDTPRRSSRRRRRRGGFPRISGPAQPPSTSTAEQPLARPPDRSTVEDEHGAAPARRRRSRRGGRHHGHDRERKPTEATATGHEQGTHSVAGIPAPTDPPPLPQPRRQQPSGGRSAGRNRRNSASGSQPLARRPTSTHPLGSADVTVRHRTPSTASVDESSWTFPDEAGWEVAEAEQAAPLHPATQSGQIPRREPSTPLASTTKTTAPHDPVRFDYLAFTADPDGQEALDDVAVPAGAPQLGTASLKLANVTTVRWINSQSVAQANAGDLGLKLGDRVLVESERHTAVALVLTTPQRRFVSGNLPTIVRSLPISAAATSEASRDRDLGWIRHAHQYCRARIAHYGLAMKLCRVERAQGGHKGIFYFSAENRIDFRELARDLSRELHTRVELRQVGVRDEARLTGSIGSCGRELCCSSWISAFQPVSIRMAKDQNLVLNPAKISGTCGRLKCCLAYEQGLYRDGRRHLPRLGETVQSSAGLGRVVELDIPRQLVRLVLNDGASVQCPASELRRSSPAAQEPRPTEDAP